MQSDRGLGLVEVIVAMLLLGAIAVAILPALWQGIILSSEQSSTATATRFLNSLVEEARGLENCTTIPDVIGRTESDGSGNELVSSGSLAGCASGSAATLTLQVSTGGEVLASTTALIYIP
ncbi:type IV pilus modification PilV family protein [Microbacterium thalassium]|uniref:Type II secretory pathway pseudopilin PulG n=1 Tax=Microbacterium thalassium TaxID=362649 RepID=A0A7X0FR93_9MICO|nr:type II secretion system protein [Microbacterium thalassium]MBB6391631.1 type II secretory pathway pseudopilin PulG [Microbacterium thalassium]GLK24234.1 hypothetical protein GCM10017607_15520 [Microbacterium thalassium]